MAAECGAAMRGAGRWAGRRMMPSAQMVSVPA